MEYVTLINRSSKTLNGTWDGRQYALKPGRHEFPRVQAEKFKAQNPVMGSEDRYTLEKQYLIGIVDDNDDITPIEQSNSVSLRQPTTEEKIVPARSVGLMSHERQASLPVDGAFVKP